VIKGTITFLRISLLRLLVLPTCRSDHEGGSMLFIAIAAIQILVLKCALVNISMFKTHRLQNAPTGDALVEYMSTMAGHTLEMERLKFYWD